MEKRDGGEEGRTLAGVAALVSSSLSMERENASLRGRDKWSGTWPGDEVSGGQVVRWQVVR